MQTPLHTPKGYKSFYASEEGTTHTQAPFTLIENGEKSVIIYKASSAKTGEIAHLPLSQVILEPVSNTQGLIRVLVPNWLHDLKKYFFSDLCSS